MYEARTAASQCRLLSSTAYIPWNTQYFEVAIPWVLRNTEYFRHSTPWVPAVLGTCTQSSGHAAPTWYFGGGYPRRTSILRSFDNRNPVYPKYSVIVLSTSGTKPGISWGKYPRYLVVLCTSDTWYSGHFRTLNMFLAVDTQSTLVYREFSVLDTLMDTEYSRHQGNEGHFRSLYPTLTTFARYHPAPKIDQT